MLGHIGINVPDLGVARRYYDTLLPHLGYELFFDTPDQFAYCPANSHRGCFLFFYPSRLQTPFDDEATGLQHLAFMVKTRPEVHEIHELVVGLGSEILQRPQEFPDYPPPYFATFWRDPHGIKLEAVCHYNSP